jgi:Zn-dependent protease
MKWSYDLARIAGIKTRVHASFGLLLLWVAFSAYRSTGSAAGALLGLAFVILIFGAVLLHELGHALTARRFGIPTRAITLYPIGGVAEIMGPPRTPKQEIAIAVAGPAVNFVLAAIFGGVSLFLPEVGLIPMFISALAWANLGLGLFNLLPAFPMDGGRVLRAAISKRYGPLRATMYAAGLGKVAAVGLFIYGLTHNPWLCVIAPVLWIVGDRELKAAHFRSQAGARAYRYEAQSMGETFVMDRDGHVHRVVSFTGQAEG